MTGRVHIEDLGTRDYKETWDLQESIFQDIVQRKIARRNAGLAPKDSGPADSPDLAMPLSRMLWVEHPHVLTLGKSGEAAHVVASPEELARLGVQYYPINRGGDITYHGPGQIVGYPILSLKQARDLHAYLRELESILIKTLAHFGLAAGRREGKTGIWIEQRKICALGVAVRKWITYHGFALNLDPDLSHFEGIVPCGITDGTVTSMQAELGTAPAASEVKTRLAVEFDAVFGNAVDFS